MKVVGLVVLFCDLSGCDYSGKLGLYLLNCHGKLKCMVENLERHSPGPGAAELGYETEQFSKRRPLGVRFAEIPNSEGMIIVPEGNRALEAMDGKEQARHLGHFVEAFQDAAQGDDFSRQAIANVMSVDRQSLEDARFYDRQLQAWPEKNHKEEGRSVMHLLAVGDIPDQPVDIPVVYVTGPPKYLDKMKEKVGIDQWQQSGNEKTGVGIIYSDPATAGKPKKDTPPHFLDPDGLDDDFVT